MAHDRVQYDFYISDVRRVNDNSSPSEFMS